MPRERIYQLTEDSGDSGHGGFSPPCPDPFTVVNQKILAALCSVIQTPHASGIPTKAQNSAAFASRPPNPMPNEPDGVEAELFAVAACSLATSSALMCHFELTGLIRKLQIR